ncbi:formylglycine-generating enzyme family protein [Pseudovibrio brasiliensis]|uniref:SUMF1/EgtB/PvdO family nonheme iron enzyme n=1 Tax=Pseudovibrio brasiliensis TaxID=1898042 RepID=A0ABX8AJB3_9HYPH|nr:SUMF1/EgtB/PvdO family nonheme iron enzyme [Pseudovibrio brasiliensis]QUS54885.1 SUMF1/EgtB/PvdO family nonheme iron enzyme [Pseudovibrio brasiliensis]
MEDLSSILLPEMMTVPAGILSQKDDRKGMRWTVQVQSFEVAKYPVTQALYGAVLGDWPSCFKGDDLPVESVGWFDALRFCNALSKRCGLEPCYALYADDVVEQYPMSGGFRLLTDAEWEYACRGGSHEPRYGPLDDVAWYAENSKGAPQTVGQKAVNAFGLHDMLGNVWEWCWDQYDSDVYGEYRIFKGGGWADEARGCLVTNRRRSHPTFRVDDLGFRIARAMRLTGSL